MLSLPMFLTSCQDILGEWDKPAPVNVTPTTDGDGGGSTSAISYLAWDSSTEQLKEESISSGYTELSSSNTDTDLPAGTYVVKGEVTITGNVTLSGDAKIILCDGAELKVNGYVYGGADYGASETYTLNIYGQSGQTGKLTIVKDDINLKVKDLKIHGGVIDITTGGVQQGIEALASDIHIYGGTVNTAGLSNGIMIYGYNLYVLGGVLNATSSGTGDAISGAVNITFSNCEATISHTGGSAKAITTTTNINVAAGITYYENATGSPSTDGGATTHVGGSGPFNCANDYVEIK